MEQKQLRVEADKCHMILNIPVYLTDAAIPQLRKMFTLICRHSYQNEQTIQAITAGMPEILEHLKADWAAKSRIFRLNIKIQHLAARRNRPPLFVPIINYLLLT